MLVKCLRAMQLIQIKLNILLIIINGLKRHGGDAADTLGTKTAQMISQIDSKQLVRASVTL